MKMKILNCKFNARCGTLILKDSKPIALVKMLMWGQGNFVFTSEKSPFKKRTDGAYTEPVGNCARLAREAVEQDLYIYSETNMKYLRQRINQIEQIRRN